MECKGESSGNAFKRVSVLIETLWNVKRGTVIATPVENIVLIETLWNVKHFELLPDQSRVPVLIETLWNVKVNTDFSLM